METRQPPAPYPEQSTPVPQRSTAESLRPGVYVRVSVLNESHDEEEEKEPGYGHGV
jgi:hypothetical protein